MKVKAVLNLFLLSLLFSAFCADALANILLTSSDEANSNLIGGGKYSYEITDEKSEDCTGEWFVGRLIWVGLQKTENLCWRNDGKNIEVKKVGFFEKSVYLPKPMEIGAQDLNKETAALFYKAKQERKEETELIAQDKKQQFYDKRPIKEFPYQAEISCTYGGGYLPLVVCMQKGNLTTNIEVRSGQDYSMVQFMNLDIANSISSNNKLVVLLRSKFQIKMQNAGSVETMDLKIVDRQSNGVVYQKSAGLFDYISATNNSISKTIPQKGEAISPFIAEISCDVYQPVFLCFMGQGGGAGSYNTTLEIRSGSNYKLYQYQDLVKAGTMFNVPLSDTFVINAQNSNSFMILNIKIKEKKTEKILYQKSAGQYDFIRIKNKGL